ncbi:MAG: class I SAM-dependent rRNA methyltransferase [Nevskia sp.]|nr:class I SAM-dependent rRNA methyltransferase [Nevskia sp.]
MSDIVLCLKAHEERRLRAGHLWVYSNEIDTERSPLKSLPAGTLCRLVDSRGKPLGTAYVNPHALLCARLLTGQIDAAIDTDWFARRLRAAAAMRQRIYGGSPYYRLVHGEGDGLPGLVIDRYGEVLVVQIGTAGMENLKAPLLDALQAEFEPRGMVLRNDSPARETENLPLYVEDIGAVPQTVLIEEGGVRFEVAMHGGQKTGWFYDQHDNRDRLARYARDARVLDVFSYAGGWALRAHGFGAKEVACIDSSATALDAALHNASLNGATLETFKGQALDVLKQLGVENRRFDLVIVDPPALIKRKKDHEEGLTLYGRLNRAALGLLAPGGVLVSCSCSYHLDAAELQRLLLRESRAAGRRLQILEQGGQGPDHPVHPAIPETRYLKAYFCAALQD